MTDRTNRLALGAAEALHALTEALTAFKPVRVTYPWPSTLPGAASDQYAANEEQQREEEDAVPYPIPSARDGWYQIDGPWCDWYTTGSEPFCEDAWYKHKAEKCYVEKPEHNAEPLTADEAREQEMEDAWQARDWETVARLQDEAEQREGDEVCSREPTRSYVLSTAEARRLRRHVDDTHTGDPLDENDHRDRLDRNGYTVRRKGPECWAWPRDPLYNYESVGWSLSTVNETDGPLTFAPETQGAAAPPWPEGFDGLREHHGWGLLSRAEKQRVIEDWRARQALTEDERKAKAEKGRAEFQKLVANLASRKPNTEPDPLDEDDHRDRIDSEGFRIIRHGQRHWHMPTFTNCAADCVTSLAYWNHLYGPLAFAPDAAPDAPRADLTASKTEGVPEDAAPAPEPQDEVLCRECGHEIDSHPHGDEYEGHCECDWHPSDIARAIKAEAAPKQSSALHLAILRDTVADWGGMSTPNVSTRSWKRGWRAGVDLCTEILAEIADEYEKEAEPETAKKEAERDQIQRLRAMERHPAGSQLPPRVQQP